jgi:4-alpha-glucanotransferase
VSSAETLTFLFGVHDHQPAGNFESVVDEAAAKAYHPFLEALREVPHFPVTVHCSGTLLAFLRERARPTFDLLGTLVSAGQVELLTGGFYEPILAMLPDSDKVGQIQALTEFLAANFGVTPRGMWLAERVWEPHLPKALREAGVEFVLLDDSHFAHAGLDPDALGAYYVTEEQGTTLFVFPISQRLRYLVPFRDPEETVRHLAGRRDAGAVTLVDDGEKFGLWPGTSQLVYQDGWLRRFFAAIEAVPWLRPSTFSRYLAAAEPSGRIYLPTASYTEMGEWALPTDAAAALHAARHRLAELPDGANLARFLGGGFWRSFLAKYPEVGDLYWKMLRLSRHVHGALAVHPGHPRLTAAREQLWRAQANDVYWHGVFGGCYLPHLRRAAKGALIACDRLLAADGADAVIECHEQDLDGDGRPEIGVRTADWSLVLHPARGGIVTELAVIARQLDLADVLTRRREAYHAEVAEPAAVSEHGAAKTIHAAATAREAGLTARLGIDRFRRASLLDGLFADSALPDPLDPWETADAVLGERPMRPSARVGADLAEVECAIDGLGMVPLAVVKSIQVPRQGAWLEIRYRLGWSGAAPLAARWGVQFNLALSAGDAPGRYFRAPGHPSLGSRGRLEHRRGIAMVDEWLGCAVELRWAAPGDVSWAPVETVSLSETGFERIYQGVALFLSWPLRLRAGAAWELALRLTVSPARAGGAPATSAEDAGPEIA